MKIIVQYSGGKDSQACMLWAAKKWGAENITVVFCDTKWESPVTYDHILNTTKQLGITPKIVSSDKYDGFEDLAAKKKRFPSSKARFCTEELKAIPFVNYILDDVRQHLMVVQGIRKTESDSRATMNAECRYFKHYFEPYTNNVIKLDKERNRLQKLLSQNKRIPANLKRSIEQLEQKISEGRLDNKYYTYRKKEVFEYCKKFDDSLFRPVFNWSAQQVIDFIFANNQRPNPLYSKGFKRVGCFPCIHCSKTEFKQLLRFYPERIEEIAELEEKLDTSFFPPDYVPKRYASKSALVKKGKNKGKIIPYPIIGDVVRYMNDKNATRDLFEQEESKSCMSAFMGICE